MLATQVPSIPDAVPISYEGIGVGIFLVITFIRNKKNYPLRTLLLIFYVLIIGLSFFAPDDFIPTAFDSGGVASGQIMTDVNREFGLSSPANGIIFAVPTEKAYKI